MQWQPWGPRCHPQGLPRLEVQSESRKPLKERLGRRVQVQPEAETEMEMGRKLGSLSQRGTEVERKPPRETGGLERGGGRG